MTEIEISQTAVNEARTSAPSDTNVTHENRARSLDVLVRDLIRIRPKLPAAERDLASALSVHLTNYAARPDMMRPLILWTIAKIEEVKKAA